MYISDWEDKVLKAVDPVCCFNEFYGNMRYSEILEHNRNAEEKAQKDYEIRLKDKELLCHGNKSKAEKITNKPKPEGVIKLTPIYKKMRSALALRIGCIFIQLQSGKLSDNTWLTYYYVPNSPSAVNQRRIHSMRLISVFWCIIEKNVLR